MVISLLFPRKFSIRTWYCNCPQYLGLLRIDVECIPSIHDQRKVLVLPNRLLYWVLSTSDQDFASFQPILCHPHTHKNNPFSRWTKRHSQFGIFSQPCFNRIFSNCLSHNSPAKRMTVQIPFKRNDWVFHTGPWFRPFCVVVDEAKCLDILTLEFSIICQHLPFSLGYTLILRLLLVHRNWYPWS